MDDLSPESIARLASRIYNERPSPNGAPHPAPAEQEVGHAPPVAPSLSPLGGERFTPESTVAPSPPSTSAPLFPPVTLRSFPAVGAPASLPSGLSSVSTGLPGSLPAGGTDSATVPSSGANDVGLKAFVSKIRATHFRQSSTLGTDASHPPDRPVQLAGVSGARPFDVASIRSDFPILHQQVHGRPLIWLDNAATTQKPQSVIDAISNYYSRDNSNIHRAAHTLAARSTDAYEGAREKVRKFINAGSTKEIVFVRGTTEGINLVAQTFGRKFLQPGDEIVLSTLEHHANIVPWQMVAKERGAVLRVIPVNDRGEVMLGEYQSLLGPRTKFVSLTHASNSLGTILPIADMIQMAKRYNARVLIDGAQSVAHLPVDVQQLDTDFFVFSGHKIFAPTGIGAVYGKEELLELIPPWQGGGSMIRDVTFEETVYSSPPTKFEAGTPSIGDAVGLGAALDYVNSLGLENIAKYEHELLGYGTEQLARIPGLRLVGTARDKVGVMSFVLPEKRTEDVGRALDLEGIAVRAGHHCAQPSLRRFGLEQTVRPSISLYNSKHELDRLAAAIRRIQRA